MAQPNRNFGDPGQSREARARAAAALRALGLRLRAFSTAGPRSAEAEAAGASAPAAAAGESVLRAVESEIIPRLLLAHRSGPDGAEPAQRARAGDALRESDHEHFLDLVLRGNAASTRCFIETLLERGVSREDVFLELLARAARRLGELWEEDRCDFSDVTIGLCRLHEALREHSVLGDGSLPYASDAPRILLATACGDQHVFGVVMVAEFFRRAGWLVWSEPGATSRELIGLVATEGFDVLGLSASCSVDPVAVGEEISAYRDAACPPASDRELRVLVGGRLFLDSPELVTGVGADAVARDARSAPATAGEVLGRARPAAKG